MVELVFYGVHSGRLKGVFLSFDKVLYQVQDYNDACWCITTNYNECRRFISLGPQPGQKVLNEFDAIRIKETGSL